MVFFRIVGLDDDTETIGGQGIPLSPGRSIAIDKALHRYGTPFFIEADLPLTSPVNRSSFRRIMIAQDTGSAIVGPARADLYFGAGNEAGQVAEPGVTEGYPPEYLVIAPAHAKAGAGVRVALTSFQTVSEINPSLNSPSAYKMRD